MSDIKKNIEKDTKELEAELKDSLDQARKAADELADNATKRIDDEEAKIEKKFSK